MGPILIFKVIFKLVFIKKCFILVLALNKVLKKKGRTTYDLHLDKHAVSEYEIITHAKHRFIKI